MSQCCVVIIGHVVVRIAKKGTKTIIQLLGSGNFCKPTKLTENANSWKAIAVH